VVTSDMIFGSKYSTRDLISDVSYCESQSFGMSLKK